ncbi:MAG: hypothetical protein RL120_12345, partial [Gammaproteobacteria bacterium]
MKCFNLAPKASHTPGYIETRRQLLITTPVVMAGLAFAPRRLLAALDNAVTTPEVDEFIDAAAQMASALKSDDSRAGQDAYVAYIADAVDHIRNVSRDGLATNSWKGFDPGVFLGELGRNRAFFIVHFALEPGALLPPHCHPRTSVCTLGIEGQARLRHFDPPVDVPDYKTNRDTEFLVTETRRVDLQAGTTSTLTEQRDNIHLFEAGPQGARGIDVTTDYGGDGSFSF